MHPGVGSLDFLYFTVATVQLLCIRRLVGGGGGLSGEGDDGRGWAKWYICSLR